MKRYFNKKAFLKKLKKESFPLGSTSIFSMTDLGCCTVWKLRGTIACSYVDGWTGTGKLKQTAEARIKKIFTCSSLWLRPVSLRNHWRKIVWGKSFDEAFSPYFKPRWCVDRMCGCVGKNSARIPSVHGSQNRKRGRCGCKENRKVGAEAHLVLVLVLPFVCSMPTTKTVK